MPWIFSSNFSLSLLFLGGGAVSTGHFTDQTAVLRGGGRKTLGGQAVWVWLSSWLWIRLEGWGWEGALVPQSDTNFNFSLVIVEVTFLLSFFTHFVISLCIPIFFFLWTLCVSLLLSLPSLRCGSQQGSILIRTVKRSGDNGLAAATVPSLSQGGRQSVFPSGPADRQRRR